MLMLAGFGSTFATLFQALAEVHAPLALSVRVVEWACTLAFLTLTLGDLHVAVEAAVAAPDLTLLRAAPLRPRELLALKLGATLPRTLPPLVGIALPAALAFAIVHGALSPAALAFALFVLWVLPMALGSALALPLLRLAPAARLRESLAVLATFAFLAGWIVNAFWIPRLILSTTDPATLLRALPSAPVWSPATWAAHVMLRPDRGMILTCLLACGVAMALASHATTRLLTHVQELATSAAARVVHARARRARTLPLAFLRRDGALAARDWPVLLDALASLALWTLLPLAVLPLAPLPPLELGRAMLVALSVSFGTDVAARALPLERTALAWVRLSPVGSARWVCLRALGVALLALVLVLAATALVCIALGLRGMAALDSLVFAVCAIFTALPTGLCMGALFGDPMWTDPRAMLGMGGRALTAGALLIQAAGWLALSHVLSPAAPLGSIALLVLLICAALVAAGLLALTTLVVERREFPVH
jgi:hypothetical protein